VAMAYRMSQLYGPSAMIVRIRRRRFAIIIFFETAVSKDGLLSLLNKKHGQRIPIGFAATSHHSPHLNCVCVTIKCAYLCIWLHSRSLLLQSGYVCRSQITCHCRNLPGRGESEPLVPSPTLCNSAKALASLLRPARLAQASPLKRLIFAKGLYVRRRPQSRVLAKGPRSVCHSWIRVPNVCVPNRVLI
jgi:hypothetical protein